MFWDWFWEYGIVILFYVSVILLIYLNRSKFHFENKFIAMYKTKFGLKFMERFAKKSGKKTDMFGAFLYKLTLAFCLITGLPLLLELILTLTANISFIPQAIASFMVIVFWVSFVVYLIAIIFFKQIKRAGTTGIHVGYVGMIFMVLFLAFGLYLLIFRPDVPPLISPVLPGVQIPGSPVKLPLLEGLIGLFVVVVVHEFSHGILARAHKIPVKSSGFVMIGPLPGAFVEPDEKKVVKASNNTQLSIFAAGPWSNILLFLFVLLVYSFIMIGVSAIYEPVGVTVVDFVNPSDNAVGGRLDVLSKGDVITEINNGGIKSIYDIKTQLENASPGDSISLQTDSGQKNIVLTSDPANESIPYLGLMLDTQVEPKQGNAFGFLKAIQGIIFEIIDILYWIFVLSLGIGIVNLLPIGPTDGGRMFYIALQKWYKKKKATNIFSKTSLILLVVLIILVFVPIIKAVFGF